MKKTEGSSARRGNDGIRTFLRFVAVGVVNTAVGYGIYALAVLFGAPPQLALILQFLLGALWNFQMHAKLVFAVSGWGRLPAYIGAYLLIYSANALALRLVLSHGIGPLMAQLLLLPFVVAASWLLIGWVMGYHARRRIG
ncbi:GtrA family protein [Paracoccus aurantiacus]|uniref:GtrA family protein n=1 Tax=Paracoccus aurantiacus TaxID=2599412 RepID=A0A5C6RWD4_9RHOB|nr:GtrA family protein [Paracoccus aurantiacus]TXB66364.1 GtrA family protein [Paracoccus aurantiacus]